MKLEGSGNYRGFAIIGGTGEFCILIWAWAFRWGKDPDGDKLCNTK